MNLLALLATLILIAIVSLTFAGWPRPDARAVLLLIIVIIVVSACAPAHAAMYTSKPPLHPAAEFAAAGQLRAALMNTRGTSIGIAGLGYAAVNGSAGSPARAVFLQSPVVRSVVAAGVARLQGRAQ